MQGKKGEAELYLDYTMSEKFGLNWKKQDYSRMNAFIEILKAEWRGNPAKSDSLENNINKHGSR